MARIRLVQHAAGAPGLRWFGLGPDLKPSRSLLKLRRLLHKHAFWAQQRNTADLKRMLAGSRVVVSLWRGKRMVGFGRATSDGIHRAVLWDVVVAGDLQGRTRATGGGGPAQCQSDSQRRARLFDDH